jgi:hypothetical protein
MQRLRPLFALWIALPLGCVDAAQLARGPVTVNDADRPDSPAAPEAPFAPPPSFGQVQRVDPPPEPSAEPSAGEGVYVCPMHADVVRDAPGKCPKCGMTLVPRPRPAPEGAPGHLHAPHGGTP